MALTGKKAPLRTWASEPQMPQYMIRTGMSAFERDGESTDDRRRCRLTINVVLIPWFGLEGLELECAFVVIIVVGGPALESVLGV